MLMVFFALRHNVIQTEYEITKLEISGLDLPIVFSGSEFLNNNTPKDIESSPFL